MKQVVLRIDDAAFEKFMGMVSLCPQVEIVDVDESAVPTQGQLAVRIRVTEGTDTVLKTKLFGLKVRHFNNSCLLIAFTRSIQALF